MIGWKCQSVRPLSMRSSRSCPCSDAPVNQNVYGTTPDRATSLNRPSQGGGGGGGGG